MHGRTCISLKKIMNDRMKYADEYLLKLSRINSKDESDGWKEESFFDGAITIKIPEDFQDMDEQAIEKIFVFNERPQYIKNISGEKAVMTMDIFNGEGTLEEEIAQIRKMIEIMYPQSVSYEVGRTKNGVSWIEYKVFEDKISHYKLYFLIDGKVRVLGSFQCDFIHYGRWRSKVIGILEEIR